MDGGNHRYKLKDLLDCGASLDLSLIHIYSPGGDFAIHPLGDQIRGKHRDVYKRQVREEIGRAKYIPEDQVAEGFAAIRANIVEQTSALGVEGGVDLA